MGKRVALVIVLCLGICATAQAQQTGGSRAGGSVPGGGLGSGTAGGSDYSSTSKVAPGAQQLPSVPGGGIPMGAATQGATDLPGDSSNLENGTGSKQR
jgi:hypothetical protein